MGLPATAVSQASLYLGDITATTDSGKAFPVFFNNSGMDIVITEAWVSGVKGADTYSYMTVNLTDQDNNTISTLAWTIVQAKLTLLTAMGTCSATHGVIPDGEYAHVAFAQTNDGDSIADFQIFLQYRYQNPED